MSSPTETELRTGTLSLALTPTRSSAVHGTCLDRAVGDRPADSRLLAVSTSGDTDAFVDEVLRHLPTCPRDMVVLDLTEASRSVTAEGPTGSDHGFPGVATAAGSGDGVDAVSETVERLAAEWDGAETPPVLYLDSLSDLLPRAGLPETVSWLDRLGDSLTANGWRGTLRLERDRHDWRTVTLLAPPFDTVLDLTADGEARPPSELGDSLGRFDSGPTADTDGVFEALQSRTRRHVLRRLAGADGPVDLSELVAAVVEGERSEDEPTEEERTRWYTGLYHNHLPKLDRTGFVEFDRESGTVEPGESFVAAEPHLLLVDRPHGGK